MTFLNRNEEELMKIRTEIIEEYRTKNKLSKSAFCRICKIAFRTYGKIMNGNYNFDVRALLRISKVLKIPIHQLFKAD